jgi:DNA-binding NarL/FixJ family response regulator
MMSCLIVDDNDRFRQSLIETLKEHYRGDVTCWECGDGAEAVRDYDRLHPDVVLMDVRMEGQDGLTATRQICERHPDAKVVIVTQYDEDSLSDAARQAGAKGFIGKEHAWKLPFVLDAMMKE